ncbi:hypothetical protein [Thomasclavelia ramosa]
MQYTDIITLLMFFYIIIWIIRNIVKNIMII